MKSAKKTSTPSKKYPPGSFMGKLRKRRIIETLIAFIACGVAAVEFVYHIIFHHYHFPRYIVDITIVGVVTAMLITVCWRWFRGEKEVETEEPKGESISFPEWKNSIVVLPFENISPEEGQDYFCDGMTEEIITDLSSIHDLRVISRSSAMMLKGSKRAVRDIAKEFNIQYVLEGSVRKVGNDLRIAAQLIDATTDAHLWAKKYSGTVDDVFEIQEKVSRAIVDALEMRLSPREIQRIGEKPISNIHAYECYLRARQEIWEWTEEGLERALKYLQQSLDIIGENALLYAGIGNVYWQYFNMGFKMDDEYLKKSEEYADKVFQLESNSSHGHRLLGLIEKMKGNIRKELEHFKKALTIDFNDPESLLQLIYCYVWFAGKPYAASPLAKKLLEIDPLTPVNHMLPGWIDWLEGRFDIALRSCEKFYKMQPGSLLSRWWYLQCLVWNEKYEEAYELIDKFFQDNPKHIMSRINLVLKYSLQGDRNRVLQLITEDLSKNARKDFHLPWIMSECFALIDEKEKSLDWLEITMNKGWCNYILFSELDPFLENIRSEPRFKKLMKRVKHEWENFEV
jgi:non-specific serine/threonine protein kinase